MSKSKLFASVAIAALMAAPAFAQTSTTPSTSPSASRPATTAPSGAPARATLPSDIGSMKVSELVGKNVYTANDEKIGDVNDVVTSKSGGEAMAVIGVGGFLGIGEKEAAVPISQLKVQGDKIVASGATKDSLKQHADYKKEKDNYTKVDRDMVVSQAGASSTGSTTRPSTSGAAGTSTSPSGAPATGATGSTGSSGSSTMGGSSTSPSTSPSTSGSSGSSGTSGMSGSGSSSGSGSMGSGSSSTSGSSTGGSSPAGNAPSSGGSATQTPKQ